MIVNFIFTSFLVCVVITSNGVFCRPIVVTRNHRHQLETPRNITPGHTVAVSSNSQGIHKSPIAFRRAFRINFPLKPKLFRHASYIQKKNLSAKRDTVNTPYSTRKHVPFLRSLNMLLGSIFHSPDSANSFENNSAVGNENSKRTKSIPGPLEQIDSSTSESKRKIHRRFNTEKGEKTTARITKKIADSKNTETTFTPFLGEKDGPYITTDETVLSVPKLFATTSLISGRVDDGHGNRNSTTNHTDIQGSDPGHNRSVQNIPAIRINANVPKYIQKLSHNASRNGTDGSLAKSGGNRASGNITEEKRKTAGTSISQCSKTVRNLFKQLESEDKNNTTQSIGDIERITTGQSKELLEKLNRERALQSNTIIGKSIYSDTTSDSSDKRDNSRNCTNPTQAQKLKEKTSANITEQGKFDKDSTKLNILKINSLFEIDNATIAKKSSSLIEKVSKMKEQAKEAPQYNSTLGNIFGQLEDKDESNTKHVIGDIKEQSKELEELHSRRTLQYSTNIGKNVYSGTASNKQHNTNNCASPKQVQKLKENINLILNTAQPTKDIKDVKDSNISKVELINSMFKIDNATPAIDVNSSIEIISGYSNLNVPS